MISPQLQQHQRDNYFTGFFLAFAIAPSAGWREEWASQTGAAHTPSRLRQALYASPLRRTLLCTVIRITTHRFVNRGTRHDVALASLWPTPHLSHLLAKYDDDYATTNAHSLNYES